VAARVGDMTISTAELDQATEALARDRREGLREGDRAHVLDRLVDEALLVQLALAQGLALRDPRTRADLTAAALELLVTEAALVEPSDEELAAFYEGRRGELRGAPRVQVTHRFARGEEAMARVMAEDTAGLDAAPLPLPSGWLSDRDLREVFGGSFTTQVLAGAEGEWLAPVERDGGVHRVRVLRREAPEAPPLAEVRDEVLALYRRERADEAVRDYLRSAREDTPITLRGAARRNDAGTAATARGAGRAGRVRGSGGRGGAAVRDGAAARHFARARARPQRVAVERERAVAPP
jgi:hypothetical protein